MGYPLMEEALIFKTFKVFIVFGGVLAFKINVLQA
jgi:hypothetical protein